MNLQIFPSENIPEGVIEGYWSIMREGGRMQMRFCTDDASMYHVWNLHECEYSQTYYVFDVDIGKVVGEFSLDHFTGRAAQVHFSTSPSVSFRDSIKHGIFATDQVLNKWTREDNSIFLNSLFGLTPVKNRVACLYNTRVGFRREGVLPFGMEDRGEVQDAVIFIKERKDGGERTVSD